MSSVQPPSFGGFRSSAGGGPFSGGGVLISGDPPSFGGSRRSDPERLVPGDIVEIASDVFSPPFAARRGGPVSGDVLISADVPPPFSSGRRRGDPFSGDDSFGGGSRRDPFSGEVVSAFYPARRVRSRGPFSGEMFSPAYYGGGRRSSTAAGGGPFYLDIYFSDPYYSSDDAPLESESFGYTFAAAGGSRAAQSKADWMESPTAHVFKVEVPGLSKEDVKVEVEKAKYLKISTKKKREEKESDQIWHTEERTSGKFERKFKLYGNPKLDAIKAKMENGVLTVVVPKGTPDVKAVEVSE